MEASSYCLIVKVIFVIALCVRSILVMARPGRTLLRLLPAPLHRRTPVWLFSAHLLPSRLFPAPLHRRTPVWLFSAHLLPARLLPAPLYIRTPVWVLATHLL